MKSQDDNEKEELINKAVEDPMAVKRSMKGFLVKMARGCTATQLKNGDTSCMDREFQMMAMTST